MGQKNHRRGEKVLLKDVSCYRTVQNQSLKCKSRQAVPTEF